jgi:hypothetical protein
MKSVIDYNIFNSVNPDAMNPHSKKQMPFPLENFDEDVANCYSQVETILLKLNNSKLNPVNDTPARKKRLNALLYKAKTCKKLLREISVSCADLWY